MKRGAKMRRGDWYSSCFCFVSVCLFVCLFCLFVLVLMLVEDGSSGISGRNSVSCGNYSSVSVGLVLVEGVELVWW